MLVALQFPLADSRAFLQGDAGVLHRPLWPTPTPDQDFVRSFGIVRRRRRGGLTGWIGENEICEAGRALLFKDLRPFVMPGSGVRVPVRVAYRRFYFDGLAVGKLEVGLSVPRAGRLQASIATTRAFFIHLLRLPVAVPNPTGAPVCCQLWEAGRHLAALYALSSSCTGEVGTGRPAPWWVVAADPLLLVEQSWRAGDDLEIPFWGRMVPLGSEPPVALSHHTLPFEGRNLRMWRIRETEPALGDWAGYGNGDGRGRCRALRIYLMRLHVERECLKKILGNVAARRIVVSPRSPESDSLQHYLNTATKRIGRLQAKSDASSETQIGELAREAEDYISPGERDAILQALRNIDVRHNIFRKVEHFVNQIVMEQVMGDKYVVGQAGAVGPQAHAHDMHFDQIWMNNQASLDLPALAAELAQLRARLKAEAQAPAHDAAVGAVASAELAATEGSGPKTLEHLAAAGKWALEVAEKIGVSVAAAALKQALGM